MGAGRGTHAGEEHFALFATLFTYLLFFSSHPTLKVEVSQMRVSTPHKSRQRTHDSLLFENKRLKKCQPQVISWY